MLVLRQVTAFIYIGPEVSGEGEARLEQPQERKRDPVVHFPAVRVWFGNEIGLVISVSCSDGLDKAWQINIWLSVGLQTYFEMQEVGSI